MPRLPEIASPAAFDELLPRSERWLDAIAELRRRHKLAGEFSQSARGSTVVFMSKQTCIKLHPPLPGYLASCRRELAALDRVADALPVPTPALVAEGELEGWRYFVSTRIAGRPLDRVWGETDAATRLRLAAALGEATRALHGLTGAAVARCSEAWETFRPSQRARCLEQERRKGLPAARLRALEEYLRRLDAIADDAPARGLLHTELGPSHVLVDEGRITGIIDFGDVMVGDPEYDLAPVGMFITQGDRAAFRAFCLAYGLGPEALADPDRVPRLMRHALLHRYGTLAWYLEYLGPPEGSLPQLADRWFGVD